MTSPPELIVGCAGIAKYPKEELSKLFKLLQEKDVTRFDTANRYPNSEKTLGEYKAGELFTIDTKAPAGPGMLTKESIHKNAQRSVDLVGIEQFNVFYLHSPDHSPDFSLAEALATVQELYKAGRFKYFGLSNFSKEEVEEVYNHCKEHDYVLPSVYQGHYNVTSRQAETELFPVLRKLGFAFNAYSPLAGGFLTKTVADIEAGAGRFNLNEPAGKLYHMLYNRPKVLAVLSDWEQIAKDAGVSKSALGYRWLAYHSTLSAEKGDGIIFGARLVNQFGETIDDIRAGPLPGDIAKRIDELWPKIKDEAPNDPFHEMENAQMGAPKSSAK